MRNKSFPDRIPPEQFTVTLIANAGPVWPWPGLTPDREPSHPARIPDTPGRYRRVR